MYIVATVYFIFLESLDIGYTYFPGIDTKKYRWLDKLFQQILDYTEIIYFLLYSSISIFCLIAIRKVDTKSYSAATLRAYKRMALVHFIQVRVSSEEEIC